LDTPHANRLADETSPYLLQHAHNPVDWYPWGPEALERARTQDKPILLSIGYSACHWCHVMEHESFEDEDVAALMNREFVCIKVDREERPDLDKIYQLGHQLLTRRPGGWPLNMFLDPRDHAPIFGGTYFPREPRHGMPAFTDVLARVAAFYRENAATLDAHRAAVRDAFAAMEADRGGGEFDAGLLDRGMSELARQYDRRHGGFGQAPKFPHPTNLEFILRTWLHASARGEARHEPLAMLGHTLHAMSEGGVHDQVGGGFSRYSVDDEWMIPHFEKMLYDNGPLLALYAEMAQLTGDEQFARTAHGIARWVMREMQSPQGGYYASLDADSEGEEGRYYVWDPREIRELVSDEQWAVLVTRYRLDGSPNFEGRFHLHGFVPVEKAAQKAGVTPAHAVELLEAAHERLLAARERRVRPGRDEKILGSWNGLMIRGMARAGRLLDEPAWIESATRAMDFVRDTLWDDGRLRAVTKDGRTQLNAYLDDYVMLADAALELVQARWRARDLRFACELLDAVLAHFADGDNGGFFFTSDDHERLLHRHKPAGDDAIASGNGVAAQVFARMGHLLGEPRYVAAAEGAVRALLPAIERYPSAHASLLIALDEILHPPVCVVLRGAPAAMRPWHARAARRVAARRIVCALPADAADLPGALATRRPAGDVVAYLCSGTTCSAPIADYAVLDRELAAGEPRS